MGAGWQNIKRGRDKHQEHRRNNHSRIHKASSSSRQLKKQSSSQKNQQHKGGGLMTPLQHQVQTLCLKLQQRKRLLLKGASLKRVTMSPISVLRKGGDLQL